jgi:hypothetical protein
MLESQTSRSARRGCRVIHRPGQAQSSITCPRILASPIRFERRAARWQPPAAPAVAWRALRNPRGRVEFEKKDESRDQRSFGKRLALQTDHQRYQVESAALSAGHKPRQIIRRMHNVRIGEKDEIRRERRGVPQTLRDRP